MEKKEFIKQWMKTYEPDTFKAGENGRYFYRSEDLSSGIDLECFFEELLIDFESAMAKESGQQCNCNLPDVSQRSELLAIAALDKIAHPIKHLQSEAEKDGAKLDGYMAIQITQDANFYQEIADKALKAIANCG